MRGVDSVMGQMLGEEQYLTACYARLNRQTRRLTVIGAGHPPLILVSRAGVPQTVELESDPLGMFGTRDSAAPGPARIEGRPLLHV